MQYKDSEKILSHFWYFLNNKDFQKILNFHKTQKEIYTKMFNEKELSRYNLLVWIAYMELLEKEKSEKYFDKYLKTLNPDKINNHITKSWLKKLWKVNDQRIKALILKYEIGKLWFCHK